MQILLDFCKFITAWYNLPFTLALLGFLGLSSLQFIGLGQEHDADADADVHVDVDHDISVDHNIDVDHDIAVDHDLDVDHDIDVDHDVSLDHDAGVGHDLDHDVDHDLGHDAGHDAGGGAGLLGVLSFFGIGKAPITVWLLALLGTFGVFGWVVNAAFYSHTGKGALPTMMTFGFILLLAVVAALVGAKVGSGLVATVAPALITTATPMARLVGRRGRVVSPQVDETYGQVKVRDPGGTLITLFAVVDPGKPAILRDSEVVLVEYESAKKVFVVVPSDL